MIERHIQTVKNTIKKCYFEKSDPHLALLELRNTPIDSVIGSPAQLLNSRRLRGTIPVT